LILLQQAKQNKQAIKQTNRVVETKVYHLNDVDSIIFLLIFLEITTAFHFIMSPFLCSGSAPYNLLLKEKEEAQWLS